MGATRTWFLPVRKWATRAYKLFGVTRAGMTAPRALPILFRLRAYGPAALVFMAENAELAAGAVRRFGPDLFARSFEGSFAGTSHGVNEDEFSERDTWLSD